MGNGQWEERGGGMFVGFPVGSVAWRISGRGCQYVRM